MVHVEAGSHRFVVVICPPHGVATLLLRWWWQSADERTRTPITCFLLILFTYISSPFFLPPVPCTFQLARAFVAVIIVKEPFHLHTLVAHHHELFKCESLNRFFVFFFHFPEIMNFWRNVWVSPFLHFLSLQNFSSTQYSCGLACSRHLVNRICLSTQHYFIFRKLVKRHTLRNSLYEQNPTMERIVQEVLASLVISRERLVRISEDIEAEFKLGLEHGSQGGSASIPMLPSYVPALPTGKGLSLVLSFFTWLL